MLAYQSLLPGGKVAVALINTNTGSAEKVTFRAPLLGALRTWSYSAGNQNSANSNIITGTAPAASFAHGITLPAESVTVLETQ